MDVLTDHDNIVDFFEEVPILSCTLRVTNKCNLHCVQCYSCAGETPSGKELSHDEIYKLLNELKMNNVMRLSFTGGEPFVRKDMLEILEMASMMGFEIYVSTNGTIHNIDFDRLAQLNLKVLQISLDGIGTTHDNIRGQEGAFNESIKFINKLKNKVPKFQIGVAYTLMRQNREEMIKLYDFVKQIPVDIFSVIPAQKMGRALAKHILSPVETKNKLDEIAAHWINDEKRLKLNIMVAPALVPDFLKSEGMFEMGYICTFPYSIAVASDGHCSLCDGLLDHKEYSLGMFDEGIRRLCEKNMVKEVMDIKISELRGVCRMCKYKKMCAGGCRADSLLKTRVYCESDIMCQDFYNAGIFPNKNLET